MLPIEKGCLAIIIKSKAGNDGKVVTVGNFIGYVKNWKYKNRWEVDIMIKGKLGNFTNTVNESCLMRIDGYKDAISKETRKMEIYS